MRINSPLLDKGLELPIQIKISFEKVYTLFQKYASEQYKDHYYHNGAKSVVEEVSKYPELIEGFSDESLLDKYKNQIDMLLDPLFPEALQSNEIKAASIPFSFTSFKFSNRFENILKNAGNDYQFSIRNFEEDMMYMMSCAFILTVGHKFPVDFKRPFFFDIPDKNSGITRHYKAAFNGDFLEVIPTEKAPKITKEDYKELLDNFDNVAIWKKKFPPNSYIMKGFGIMNLFDVTADETIASISNNLLKNNENLLEEVRKNLREFFNIPDLMLGFSVFDLKKDYTQSKIKLAESLLFSSDEKTTCSDSFCHHTVAQIFNLHNTVAISDVPKYGVKSDKNAFYKRMKKANIGSIILIPIKSSAGNDLSVLEIASPRPYELNSINQNKLKDIIPAFETAIDRYSEERRNQLEATIQEHYTSLHNSVKWRFEEAAEQYLFSLEMGDKNAKPEQIIFENVYPLYGQTDIKGSSQARNEAIQEDLTVQLQLAVNVLKKACSVEKLPIYEELMFRVQQYAKEVKKGLNAGDEIGILDFLKQEIYPVFKHIKVLSIDLEKEVDVYMNRLDNRLHVIYDKRKDYENSVSFLNDKLSEFIDRKQLEAQKMYPHYFERYKTDGIEHDMYIGQSLVRDKSFDNLYLQNLRLWQLQLIVEMENIAYIARKNMPNDLRVASLVLVHSNPLAIKFRMDEKQFDVDGAYNIRYEIIKKRIDKAHIKGTDERLTTPGKIAIVYTQDKDAREYTKYIKYLQSKQLLGEVERVELEDLQGVSGLKALRVEVLYQKDFDEHKTITFQDLIKEIKA